MSSHSLSTILTQLRRRVVAIDGAAGVLWGIVAAVVCVGLGVWFDLMLELPPQLRVGILVSATLAAAGLLSRAFYMALTRGSARFLAQRLDEVLGSGGQILSGVELSFTGAPVAYSRNPELTHGLADLAVHRATRLAASASPVEVYPARVIRRSALWLGLVAAAAIGITLFMPGLAATEWRRFADPFGDHPPFSTIELDVEPGDAQVVFGQGLDIHVTSRGGPVDGVELVLRSESAEDVRRGSGGMAGAQNGHATEEILPMFPESSVRWRATVASVVSQGEYFVRAKHARSRRFRIDVVTVPRIEAVTFRVTPPAYTRLLATEGPVPPGGLSGLAGTIVEVSVRSNRNLSGGTLIYAQQEGKRDLPLLPVGGGSEFATATFAISGSGRMELRVVDVAGQISAETFTAPITQLVDEHPFVRLLEPKAVSYATPTAVIPVVISAEDDYGISHLQFFRSLNDSRYLPADVAVASPPPRQVYQVIPLPFAAYGLEPGDEIKLFARVEDNDPQARADDRKEEDGDNERIGKGAESTVVLIRIISQDEFDRMLSVREGFETLMSKYQEVRRRMETLAEAIDTLQKKTREQDAESPSDESTRAELERLAGEMQEAVETLEKMLTEQQHFAIEKEFVKELTRLKKSLEEHHAGAQSLAKKPAAQNEEIASALETMLDELRSDRAQLDSQVMEPLEMLAKILPLKQDEARFLQLYRLQRDLEDRLASLKGFDAGDNPSIKARMRDLEAEQRQIHQELDSLLDDIEDHATRISGDESLRELHATAIEFVQALRESGATEAMISAETGLTEFSGTQGHRGAKEAADILEKFIAKCQGMGQQGNKACPARFSPSLSEAMLETMEQMLQHLGLGGQGFGAGGQGGYSARRDSLQNVGLYGQTPTFDSQPRQGEGKSSRQRGGAGGQGAGQGDALSQDGESHRAEGRFKATSGSDEAIPLRYRRQVGKYFQRIGDDLGNP